MTQNVFVPLISSEGKTTKELVILILTREWPLPIKKIYNEVKKESKQNLTYQAIHKTLKQLVDESILLKKQKKYALNPEWIQALKDFTEKIDN